MRILILLGLIGTSFALPLNIAESCATSSSNSFASFGGLYGSIIEHPCDIPAVFDQPCDITITVEDPCDIPVEFDVPCDVPTPVEDPCDTPVVFEVPCDIPDPVEDPCDVPEVVEDPCDVPEVVEDPCDVPEVVEDPCPPVRKRVTRINRPKRRNRRGGKKTTTETSFKSTATRTRTPVARTPCVRTPVRRTPQIVRPGRKTTTRSSSTSNVVVPQRRRRRRRRPCVRRQVVPSVQPCAIPSFDNFKAKFTPMPHVKCVNEFKNLFPQVCVQDVAPAPCDDITAPVLVVDEPAAVPCDEPVAPVDDAEPCDPVITISITQDPVQFDVTNSATAIAESGILDDCTILQ